MTTRRRITCSILSALLFASCALFVPETPQRLVRVKALADPSFRNRNPRWQEEARGLIEATSDYFEREFAIRIVTESVSPWPEHERVPSTPALLARLQKEFSITANSAANYDLIVAFSGERASRIVTAGRPRVDRIGNCNDGLARYIVIPTREVFRYTGVNAEPEFDVLALIHEFGHIFGAEHVEDTLSIMHEEHAYRTQFDAKNRAVVEKNRLCRFAK